MLILQLSRSLLSNVGEQRRGRLRPWPLSLQYRLQAGCSEADFHWLAHVSRFSPNYAVVRHPLSPNVGLQALDVLKSPPMKG